MNQDIFFFLVFMVACAREEPEDQPLTHEESRPIIEPPVHWVGEHPKTFAIYPNCSNPV